ncbi:MAG: RagB/SusD family nutrient uptake outer membrane protein [Cyclobacteriaceae bacterium]
MKNRNIFKSKILKVFTLLMAFTVFSCNDILDAENPNSLVEDDLSNPAAARPMANGSQATVTRAIGNLLTPYSISSDEMVWSGSRDDWQQLNFGFLSASRNEFTDAAFSYAGEARWWADEVITRIEGFQADGLLIAGDELALARAYLYGATIYITIGDMYTDFTFSDKLEPSPAIGAANMNGLYDTAIGYLTKAVALNQSSLTGQLQGMLARAHWSKEAWSKARARTGGTAALINNTAAVTAANAALAAGSVAFVLDVDSSTPDVINGLPIGSEVNDRKEQRLSDAYIIVDPTTNNSVKDISSGDPAKSISLMDPIDGIPDPVLYATVVDFVTSQIYPDFTQTSNREMYLILAEAALAASNTAGFATNINLLRALNSGDGLTPWVDEVTSGVSAQNLLIHERRVNLYLQGRRLFDHYRFNDPSPYWQAESDAMKGVAFFPIGISERRANTLIPLD